jgi:MYXO-CTERM domain-containing protein
MRFFRVARRMRVLFLVNLCVIGGGAIAQAGVMVTKVGTPTFVPSDFHLFVAPIGTAATGYAEFTQAMEAILPPPNHVLNPILGIGPGVPHAGPYDQEMGQGVAANGFVESTTFSTSDYSNGTGVYLVFMLIPGPGSSTGSSPDFASGPIIPNAIFPLTIDGNTFTQGMLNDVLGQFQVPAIDQVPGFEGLEGYSHIPFFFADNFDFAARPVTGDYEYRISLLDDAGNGFQIVAPFQVVSEPSSWVMMVSGCLALGGLALHRRRRRSGAVAF